MNVAVIIGNLARDPDVRYGRDNLAIARITVAVQRIPSQSKPEPGADFISVVVFGKQAENVERYLKKGNKVSVEGRIQTGSYENKSGQTVYTTEIVANRVEFLTPRTNSGSTGGNAAPRESAAPASVWDEPAASSSVPKGFTSDFDEDDDNDIPF
jgi:single-strand DNA-binding protein